MKKIIVTGAGGFIGRTLINKLSQKKNNLIIAIDNNFRGSLKKIKKAKNIKKIKIDVTKKNKLKKIFNNSDTCYHLAAINGTNNFYKKPKEVLETGIKGTLNVLEESIRAKLKSFIFFSSSEAYQKPHKIPTKETEELKIPDVFNPRLSYGGSKIIGELLTVNYLKNTGIKYKILRPHNVYGPDMGRDHVMPELIRKIKMKKKEKRIKIKILGSGNESRSFIYISDAVNAIIRVVNKGIDNQIYNIGTDYEITIKKLILIIGKILNKKISISAKPLHRGSVSRRCPDVKKLNFLSHKNLINFEKGLKKTLEYYY